MPLRMHDLDDLELTAVNLARLPPVDLKHCDTSAIMFELQGLRAEVQEFGKLQDEVVTLRMEVEKHKSELPILRGEIRELSNWRSEIPVLRAKVNTSTTHQREMSALITELLNNPKTVAYAEAGDFTKSQTDANQLTKMRRQNSDNRSTST